MTTLDEKLLLLTKTKETTIPKANLAFDRKLFFIAKVAVDQCRCWLVLESNELLASDLGYSVLRRRTGMDGTYRK